MKRTAMFLTTLFAGVSLSTAALAAGGHSFSDIDKDGDQNISQTELQEAGMEDMDVTQLDQDNDGVLSEEEFQAAQQQQQQQQGQQEQPS